MGKEIMMCSPPIFIILILFVFLAVRVFFALTVACIVFQSKQAAGLSAFFFLAYTLVLALNQITLG
jgi:hypothetical protein